MVFRTHGLYLLPRPKAGNVVILKQYPSFSIANSATTGEHCNHNVLPAAADDIWLFIATKSARKGVVLGHIREPSVCFLVRSSNQIAFCLV